MRSCEAFPELTMPDQNKLEFEIALEEAGASKVPKADKINHF